MLESVKATAEEAEIIWQQMKPLVWGLCGILLPTETSKEEYFHQGFTAGAAFVLGTLKQVVKDSTGKEPAVHTEPE